jgi:hypothetical protein
MNHDDVFPEATNERPGSMVMVEVNGQQYPMKTATQCRTCMSPYRRQIEQYLIEGMSYGWIANEIGGYEKKKNQRFDHPTLYSVREHVARNHMPLGPTAERALIEQRSQEIGRDLEQYQGSLVDHVAANQLVISRGMAKLARGELSPSMSDLLNAVRMQQSIEQSKEEGVDSAAWQEALVAYMEVAQQFIPPESIQSYGQALAQHPVLRAMMGGQQRPAIDGEVVAESDGG